MNLFISKQVHKYQTRSIEMSIPKRIKPKGSEKSYILESAAPHLEGERVKYNGGTYVEEELPAEFVMFEGVAYKRTMSVEEFNKKSLLESAGKPVSVPKKIRVKGTQTVLEAIDQVVGQAPSEKPKNSDPTAEEMRQYLAPLAKQYEGDEFDIEAAIYWYASDYHSGQNSNLYSALSTSEFRPSRLSKGIDSEGVVAEELYSALESNFGGGNNERREA
jgi:hypothetical protein